VAVIVILATGALRRSYATGLNVTWLWKVLSLST